MDIRRKFHCFLIKILALIFFICRLSWGFSQDIHFEKVLDGPLNSVRYIRGISQDKQGYIWVCSSVGLYRYDGTSFKSFPNPGGNGDAATLNDLTCITIDSTDMIWAGTWGAGIEKLDPATGIYTSFRHNARDVSSLVSDTILSIMTDHLGNLWVGTFNGLDRLDRSTGSFVHYPVDKGDPIHQTDNSIFALYEDSQNIIWFSYGHFYLGEAYHKKAIGGLNSLDPATGKCTNYFNKDHSNKLANDIAYAISEDSSGNLWLGMEEHELQMLDRRTGKFTRFPFDPSMSEKADTAISEVMPFIKTDKLGYVWVGSAGHGINRYDPVNHKRNHYGSQQNPGGVTYMNQDTVSGYESPDALSGFCSRDGTFWVGIIGGDVYKAISSHTGIPYFNIRSGANSFYEQNDSIIWIATSVKGIDRRNMKTGKDQWIAGKKGDLSIPPDHDITGLRADESRNLWFSTFNGLYKFNPSGNAFSRYTHDSRNNNSVATDSIQCIEIDKQNLWIGTYGSGLDRMDISNGHIEHYIFNKNDSNSISNKIINVITKDNKGDIWIGTFKGLCKWDHATNKFTRYLKQSEVLCICVDSRGEIWVGATDGFYYFDSIKNTFAEYVNYNSPIKISNVLHVLEDNSHNLWLTTSNVMIRIDRQARIVNVFGKNYGIHYNNYYDCDNLKLANGRLLIGDQNGFYLLDPDALHINSGVLFLNFTGFRINDEEIHPGQGSVLNTAIWKVTEINLTYKQTTFSVDFSATDYAGTGATRYLYMMENYDNNWREIGTEHKAYFFNVPPGKYRLLVKAINADGISVEKDISIAISPPWWQKWWAYTLFAILFISAVWSFIYYRSVSLRKANRLLEEKVTHRTEQLKRSLEELKATQSQLIQSEKMASLGELTAGIAHEIQNPLNFVNNFSDVNKELLAELKEVVDQGNMEEVKAIANDVIQNEEKINHHGKRADAIVKGMLQHSRSSTGQKELSDINTLADEYLRLSYHGLRAKDKSFNATMNTDFDSSIGKINIVPQDIGRVLLNLYNNAFYAVNEKSKQQIQRYEPTVSVNSKKSDDKILLTVMDNGNGISQKVIDKIFQPFFTTKPTGQGTGLGLSLSYDIIKAHGGEIKVNTKENEGTEFIIELPLKS